MARWAKWSAKIHSDKSDRAPVRWINWPIHRKERKVDRINYTHIVYIILRIYTICHIYVINVLNVKRMLYWLYMLYMLYMLNMWYTIYICYTICYGYIDQLRVGRLASIKIRVPFWYDQKCWLVGIPSPGPMKLWKCIQPPHQQMPWSPQCFNTKNPMKNIEPSSWHPTGCSNHTKWLGGFRPWSTVPLGSRGPMSWGAKAAAPGYPTSRFGSTVGMPDDEWIPWPRYPPLGGSSQFVSG